MLHRKHQSSSSSSTSHSTSPTITTTNVDDNHHQPVDGKLDDNVETRPDFRGNPILNIVIPSSNNSSPSTGPSPQVSAAQSKFNRSPSFSYSHASNFSPISSKLKSIANSVLSPTSNTGNMLLPTTIPPSTTSTSKKKQSNEFVFDDQVMDFEYNNRIDSQAADIGDDIAGPDDTGKLKNNVIIAASIVLWYTFSVSISVYNKWMFNPDTHFSFPILITSCHQFILFMLSGAVLLSSKKFRLRNPQLSYLMNWKSYLFQIVPCSISSAADIGLGNFSFKFITLSLYTMIKSSAIVFVLLWGVIFKLEKLSFRICLIVFIMSVGVMMMVQGQHQTHDPDPHQYAAGAGAGAGAMAGKGASDASAKAAAKAANHLFIGCFLVFSSACMSGLRWTLTQILLKKNSYTKNPILTIFYLSPSMCLFLVAAGGFIEGWSEFANAEIWEEKGFLVTIALLTIPGVLAFMMTLSEFTLLKHATLLTLSIAGIFKELLTVSISAIVFGDRLNFINVIGLIVTLLDIFAYNYYRYEEQQLRRQQAEYHKLPSVDRPVSGEEHIELKNV